MATTTDGDNNPHRLALDLELLGVAQGVQPGQPATANITPISHLGVHLARFHAAKRGDGDVALVDASGT